jgi:primosomal protein N' (replication factor Y)
MPIIRVALDVPVNTLFDYLAPDEVTGQDVGLRVRVPFGKNTLTGVIMEVMTHSEVPPQRLRYASHVFRDVPPLPKDLLDLFGFCSEYYHHPLGEAVMNGLPTRLRSNKPFTHKKDPDFQYRLTLA